MFKQADEMFKDDIKILKEHIYIKRRQVNAYHEIKASLSENENDQQDAIQSAYFGNQCLHRYLHRVVMLKVLIITMLETTMLSLLPKVPTTIETRL